MNFEKRQTVILVIITAIALILGAKAFNSSDSWGIILYELFLGISGSAIASLTTVLLLFFLQPEGSRIRESDKEIVNAIDRRLDQRERELKDCQQEISDLKGSIMDYRNSVLKLIIFKDIESSGIKRIFDCHPLSEINADMKNAKKKIVILHTWFSGSRLVADIIKEIYEQSEYEQSDPPEVKILLLSPKSYFSKTRSEESKLPNSLECAEKTFGCLKDLLPLIQLNNNRLQIKTYDSTPVIALFQIDNRIYYTPLLYGITCSKHSWYMFEFEDNQIPKIVEILLNHVRLIDEDEKSSIVDSKAISEFDKYINQKKFGSNNSDPIAN